MQAHPSIDLNRRLNVGNIKVISIFPFIEVSRVHLSPVSLNSLSRCVPGLMRRVRELDMTTFNSVTTQLSSWGEH